MLLLWRTVHGTVRLVVFFSLEYSQDTCQMPICTSRLLVQHRTGQRHRRGCLSVHMPPRRKSSWPEDVMAKLHPEERCESSNAARAGTPLTQETQRVKAQRTEEWVRAGQPWELPVTGQKAERDYTGQRQAKAGGNPALPEQG